MDAAAAAAAVAAAAAAAATEATVVAATEATVVVAAAVVAAEAAAVAVLPALTQVQHHWPHWLLQQRPAAEGAAAVIHDSASCSASDAAPSAEPSECSL